MILSLHVDDVLADTDFILAEQCISIGHRRLYTSVLECQGMLTTATAEQNEQ